MWRWPTGTNVIREHVKARPDWWYRQFSKDVSVGALKRKHDKRNGACGQTRILFSVREPKLTDTPHHDPRSCVKRQRVLVTPSFQLKKAAQLLEINGEGAVESKHGLKSWTDLKKFNWVLPVLDLWWNYWKGAALHRHNGLNRMSKHPD